MTVKKVIFRGSLGILFGICVGTLITIFISLFIGNGNYYVVAPELLSKFGDEISAVVVQYILCGILGLVAAIGYCIFEIEDLGMTKQTILHFILTVSTTVTVAYICNWFKHNIISVLIYIAIFIIIYFCIWISQYLFWKNKIKRINNKFTIK